MNKLLFPECYTYTADRFKNEKAYLQDINANHYLAGTHNIKFTIKVVKLSMSITKPETRGAIQYLYDKHIDQFFDWHKEYDWYELKSVLGFLLSFRIHHLSSM